MVHIVRGLYTIIICMVLFNVHSRVGRKLYTVLGLGLGYIQFHKRLPETTSHAITTMIMSRMIITMITMMIMMTNMMVMLSLLLMMIMMTTMMIKTTDTMTMVMMRRIAC